MSRPGLKHAGAERSGEKTGPWGDHFKTDIGQLQQFLTNLEKCVDELNEARSPLDHVRADQIGTPRLDEACDKFQDEWKYGSEKTKELIDEIKEGVKANKKGYEEVEDALEKALKQIAEKSTSGDGGGK